MSTLKQLREGAGRLWDHLSEGWRQLYERTADALTRFHPVHHQGEGADEAEHRISTQSARWGLLAAEVLEGEDQVEVRLEVPGMNGEDFDIQVLENLLVVRGEKRVERERSQGRYYVMERAYGAFERAVQLPAEVDESGAKARYRNGVLHVTLAKRHRPQRRRIEVQAG